MRLLHISRSNLERVHRALATLQTNRLKFRGYYRTVGEVLDDPRNISHGVPIRLNQELLVDLGQMADRGGPYDRGLHADQEDARQLLVAFWAWASQTRTFHESEPGPSYPRAEHADYPGQRAWNPCATFTR